MGLFISNCKKCDKEIHWFLDPPSHTCKNCGTSMTPEEVDKSWWGNYDNRHGAQSASKTDDPK